MKERRREMEKLWNNNSEEEIIVIRRTELQIGKYIHNEEFQNSLKHYLELFLPKVLQ
jgi:hypothetical protein